MPRPKKEMKVLNIKLALAVSDKLEAFCNETGMTKTIAVEKILSQYFTNYFSRSEKERRLFM